MPGEYSTPERIVQLKFLANGPDLLRACVAVQSKSIIEYNKQSLDSGAHEKKKKL
jgi:hypothetical protein